MQTFLGIDIGVKSGAFALIRNDFSILRCENFTNITYFYNVVLESSPITFCAIEQVCIWPGASAQSSTTFMKNAGGYEALLEVLGIKREIVNPKKWQKDILGDITRPTTRGLPTKEANRLKRDFKKKIKATSIKKASERFGIQIENDGIADALNIALYGMRVFNCEIKR